MEYNLLQHDLPETERLVESDVECLNLNVAVPEGVAQGNDLPVLVFFHGGGLNLGSANWPQNNLVNFVKYSSSIDMPLIVVGVK